MSLHRIVPLSQKLIGDVAQLMFALLDRLDQKCGGSGFRCRRRQPPQLPFELLFPFPHLRQLVRESGEGAPDVIPKLIHDVPDGVRLQDLALQLIQQLLFNPVLTHGDGIGAGPAVEVLRAAVPRVMAVGGVSGNDDEIGSAQAAFQQPAQEIGTCDRTRNQNAAALAHTIGFPDVLLTFAHALP
nr:hypothetical protein [Edaphobacter flagellatus]